VARDRSLLDGSRRPTATLEPDDSAQEATVITLTDNAAVKVKDLIAQEGDETLMLRVAVRPGGCSGFSYEMFFDSELENDDLTLDYSGV
jgi:Fe-S cluster assembly iron-binding protein IscA